MKKKLRNEPLLLNILAALLIIVVTFSPSDVLHMYLGWSFMLFFTGYTLIAALFPGRNALDSIHRVEQALPEAASPVY